MSLDTLTLACFARNILCDLMNVLLSYRTIYRWNEKTCPSRQHHLFDDATMTSWWPHTFHVRDAAVQLTVGTEVVNPQHRSPGGSSKF